MAPEMQQDNDDLDQGDELDQQLQQMAEDEGQAEQQEQQEQQPGEDTQAAGDDGGDQARTESVPLGTALEWRRERNELRHEVGQVRQQINDLVAAIKQGGETQEDPPSLEDSPVEFLAHQSQKAIEEVNSLKTALQQQDQVTSQRNLQAEITAVERAYAQEQKDYFDATKFLTEKRMTEFQDRFGLTQAEAQKRFSEETAMFIAAAARRGESFAAAAYKLAVAEGYKPSEGDGGNQGDGGGNEAAKLNTGSLKDLARKQSQSRTLAASSGKVVNDELTPEDAADMSDTEFDKLFLGEAGDKRLKEMFGG